MSDKARVLIVDDELGPRESFRMILGGKYDLDILESGLEAVRRIERQEPDIVLLDIKMPEIDGIEVLSRIKANHPHVEVAMITAYATLDTAKRAIDLGAMGYLTKPFSREEVEELVERGIERRRRWESAERQIADLQAQTQALAEELERMQGQLKTDYQQTVTTILKLLEARDEYTGHHCMAVGRMVRDLASAFEFPADTIEVLEQAAVVHDLGKMKTPEHILRKPGPLDADEWVILRQHPILSAELISEAKFLEPVIPAVRHHHERHDGSGYPDGLAGTAIPLPARIISVCDSIHAMASHRPYRDALAPERIIEELLRARGSQFDPDVVNLALEMGLPFRHYEDLAKPHVPAAKPPVRPEGHT
jgi:putative nucleotidyltransferase with HDIG domain